MQLFRKKEPASAQASAQPSRAGSIAASSRNSISTNPFEAQSGSNSPRHSHRFTTKIDETLRFKAITKHLYAKACSMRWISGNRPEEGVLIRKAPDEFVVEPPVIHPDLLAAVQKINPGVAITMATDGTEAIFDVLEPNEMELMFHNGSQIQIFQSMAQLAAATAIKKFQYAALLREERILLVWHDDLSAVLSHATEIESRILALVWGSIKSPFGDRDSATMSKANSTIDGYEIKSMAQVAVDEVSEDVESLSKDSKESLARPLFFTSSAYVGLAFLSIVCLVVGLGGRALIMQTLVDKFYPRLALILVMPINIGLGLYCAIVVWGNIFQAVGPITGITSNSRFHSAVKPDLAQARALGFTPSDITIQMPIYTESLEGVVKPTVASLQAAISFYESRGGTARIFINDDGMAIRSEEENKLFLEFYRNNNIGWVARPKHNTDGYVRRGKFKKASNMNFALNVANRVEDVLQGLVNEKSVNSIEEEDILYRQALTTVLESDSRIKAGGNIRVGELILIVDSDTIVPKDCLMYGAAEMFLSPEVAIVQHACGVMQVSWDYFENGITYFTNLVYTAIKFAAGSGEVAPFVGHNAFLRWEAIQSVAYPPEGEIDYTCFWSESHVSEDFDIALRLQIGGNVVRLASYHGPGFREGVSLSVFDELDRWEKYAYGCNELVFNPIHTWLWRGPFTKLFRTFLFSSIQLSSKISICGYIFSYYALASAVPLGFMNYFLIGWLNGSLDKFYIQSWEVFIVSVIVFNLMSNITVAILRYRIGEAGLLNALVQNFKWTPFFMFFFGGVSFHILLAICAHMFSINMSWGATAKEKENSNFFQEIPKIFKRFKWMYLIMLSTVGGMIYLGCFAPRGWDIAGLTSVLPWSVIVGMHCLLPLVLNPSLMIFNY